LSRRFFNHGELPLVLLALLSERERHGYEVMAELSRLFKPHYRPSPGSVYPALAALETEALIEGRPDGDKTTYRTTVAGDQALAEHRDLLAAVELRTGARFGSTDSIVPLLARFKARLAPLSGRVEPKSVATVLERAAAEIESLNGLSPVKETD
jgi:DNA-binding PadR family transcriptional regulator